MKPNRYQQVVRQGNVPVGHMILEFCSRGLPKMLAQADLDFVIIDTEHSAFSSADVANLVSWFQATDIAPFVRIPQIEYHLIARTLDAGALGIMVPNVKNGEQAKAIVDAAKYAPLGQRGVILGNAHTDFATVAPNEFLPHANENTTIICQIESVEGLENIEAIATTPGVDVLWVGHFDLTQSMGIPGQFDTKQFLDALDLVIKTANKHGLQTGIQPGSLEQATAWMEIGFNVISFSADIAVYMQAMASAAQSIREL